MGTIRNWMAQARRLEEAGDMAGALASYRKALVMQEETSGFADLSLYNRLGDLHLRCGDIAAAVRAYDRAAAHCEEQQLYANGIALCKKILRNTPEDPAIYRRMARLLALSGLEAEARTAYRDHAARAREAGRSAEAEEGFREFVELVADEEGALELAELMEARGDVEGALAMLRHTRDRREGEGRSVVGLLRKIQELQPHARKSTGHAGGAADAPRAGPETDLPGRIEEPEDGDDGDGEALSAELTRELHRVLSRLEGEERFRHALPIIDHLLEIQPGRFELLHRKLAYAFTVGEQEAAVAAYLAIGECLDRHLPNFKLRSLSTSTDTGATTAAINVQRSPGIVPGL